ncbi:MAG: 2-C-methyl-D-erythritol 4-phosphate cytidylyltransferase [Cytophagaceae bacterium]|nr:2-C-methyl-D-erythritol 4-phosphate cytidylyltransferase [Cytophagaceae bacterium]
MTAIKKYAIIVAGGSGSRMKSEIPKQFILLGNLPILMHTIKRYADYSKELDIIVVLPKEQIPVWGKLCTQYNFIVKTFIVSGGETRFQSVKNGLDSIKEKDGLVAIHDGVRPFVNFKTIEESFKVAEKTGNATASVALKESIRYVDGNTTRAEDRSKYRILQTPQTFQIALLKKAYLAPELPTFTDDGSVLEKMGERINLIEGSYENIKITTPEDLVAAEGILKSFKYL